MFRSLRDWLMFPSLLYDSFTNGLMFHVHCARAKGVSHV